MYAVCVRNNWCWCTAYAMFMLEEKISWRYCFWLEKQIAVVCLKPVLTPPSPCIISPRCFSFFAGLWRRTRRRSWHKKHFWVAVLEASSKNIKKKSHTHTQKKNSLALSHYRTMSRPMQNNRQPSARQQAASLTGGTQWGLRITLKVVSEKTTNWRETMTEGLFCTFEQHLLYWLRLKKISRESAVYFEHAVFEKKKKKVEEGRSRLLSFF